MTFVVGIAAVLTVLTFIAMLLGWKASAPESDPEVMLARVMLTVFFMLSLMFLALTFTIWYW